MKKPTTKRCNHPCCSDTECRKSKPKKNRTPLKRSKKRTNPVSRQQAKRLQLYRKLKQRLFADENICAVALLENKSKEVIELFKDCTYEATQYHHSGGKIGDDLFDPDGKKVCANCHRVLECHPDLSKSLGLSRDRLVRKQS